MRLQLRDYTSLYIFHFFLFLISIQSIASPTPINPTWIKNLTGFTSLDACLDTLGNTYVVGYKSLPISSGNFFKSDDFTVEKTDPDGITAWSVSYPFSLSLNSDRAITISCFNDRIFVSGIKVEGPTRPSLATPSSYRTTSYLVSLRMDNGNIIFSSQITPQFLQPLGYIPNTGIKGTQIDVDGNVYVYGSTGTYTSQQGDPLGQQYWYIIKFDLNGNELWQNIETGTYLAPPSYGTHNPTGVVLDGSDVFFYGYVTNNSTYEDLRIVKYDSVSGGRIISSDYDQDSNVYFSRSIDMIINNHTPFLLAKGRLISSNSATGVVLILNSNLNIDFNIPFSPDQLSADNILNPTGFTISNNDEIFVSGHAVRNHFQGTNADIFLTKISQPGSVDWIVNYDGVQGSSDLSYGIYPYDQNNIIITGSTMESNSDSDLVALFFDPSNGTVQKKLIYAGPYSRSDWGSKILKSLDESLRLLGFVSVISSARYEGVLMRIESGVINSLSPTVRNDDQPYWKFSGSNFIKSGFQNTTLNLFNLKNSNTESYHVQIFNLAGQLISEWNQTEPTLNWNGTSATGSPVASGEYLILVNKPQQQTFKVFVN